MRHNLFITKFTINMADIYTQHGSLPPTQSPIIRTYKPTTSPTNTSAITVIPPSYTTTNFLSILPTNIATELLTNTPTITLTNYPTYASTISPADILSFSQIPKPTFKPTTHPTYNLSQYPSITFTNIPTISPSITLTYNPSINPSAISTETHVTYTHISSILPTYLCMGLVLEFENVNDRDCNYFIG